MTLDKLRAKAEFQLEGKTNRLKELLPHDLHHAIHELYTYQVELELQNEELRQTQQALLESRDRYASLYDSAPIGFLTLNNKNIITEANLTCIKLLGKSHNKIINTPLSAFIVADFQDTYYHFMRLLKQTGHSQFAELQLITSQVRSIWVRLECSPVLDSEGKVLQMHLSVSNVSATKQAEQSLIEQHNLLRSIIESSPDLIAFKNTEFIYQSANQAFCRFIGRTAEDIQGKTDFELFPEPEAASYRSDDSRLMASGESQIKDEEVTSQDGLKWLHIARTPVLDAAGSISGILCSMRDISQRKLYEEQIWQQANYDAVTRLPNRTLFIDRLHQALHLAHRDGKRVAVIFIDLDHFKLINDSMGHGAGDQLLEKAASRMKDCARETDTVARLSGDEFTVILSNIEDRKSVQQVVEKMLASLDKPFSLLGNDQVSITGSAGITLYPDDGSDINSLLNNADVAMYRAKAKGRNQLVFFSPEMNASFNHRINLQHDLYQAVENAEWVLHYQPIIELKTGNLVAAEALVRWLHPEQGLLEPEKFLTLAEETGLITPLGEWVLQTAARQINIWRKLGYPSLRIAVNISSRQCKEDSFEKKLRQILQEAETAKGSLRLEITDSIMLDHVEENIARLQRIEDSGVALSLDDFGTGFSSLIQLKRLPVDTVKVEREFIRDIFDESTKNTTTDTDDALFVKGIMVLAHNFNIKVIAQGIENERQLEFLKNANADYGQGYYFSKALPAKEFEAFMRSHHGE